MEEAAVEMQEVHEHLKGAVEEASIEMGEANVVEEADTERRRKFRTLQLLHHL